VKVRVKRYDPDKRGSFTIEVEFFDWELSSLIGALRSFRREHELKRNKAYATFLTRLEDKLSKALGSLLRAEFRDLVAEETLEEVLKSGGPS
jgi:hypothetical protein